MIQGRVDRKEGGHGDGEGAMGRGRLGWGDGRD